MKKKNFDDIRDILSIIRESEKDSYNNKSLITEDIDKSGAFVITKRTPQFSDVRISQEKALLKTIGESIDLDENALVYYPKIKDLVLSGKINSLKIAFQFRYNDPSGDGCYLWANSLQLTDVNNRTIGKIRDAFLNWKQSLIENGDLIEKLHKTATKED